MRPTRRYALHLTLFGLTWVTTTWAGALQTHPSMTWGRLFEALPLLVDGLPFSLALMAILTSHEMGHFVAARLHRVEATLPLFIPMPLGLIGTLGAVIGMPSAVRDRNALADIGAAGPLAGLVVAIPLLVYGLHLSPVQPQTPGGLLEGNSVLYLTLKWLVKGRILPGGGLDVQLHPVAWAGWVGLLVTMINLLPIGQLDGGHIAYAYFGDRHDRAAGWLHRALPLMGLIATAFVAFELSAVGSAALVWGFYAGAPWFIWGLLLSGMRRLGGGRYHPPVGERPLTSSRRRLCQAMLFVLLLILTPIPLRPTL